MRSTFGQSIPVLITGSYIGASSKSESRTRHDALVLFRDAKERLLNVNDWNSICGKNSSEFRLTTATGELLPNARPATGNLICVKSPTAFETGILWLRIEDFEESKNLLKDEESFSLRVRTVRAPDKSTGEGVFVYIGNTSSTFLVIRKSSTVHVLECGKGEAIAEPSSALCRLRSRLVAISTAFGVVNPQWKNLVKGILKPL